MSKKTILSNLYLFLTTPVFYLGIIFFWKNTFNLRINLLKCSAVVDSESEKIPECFVEYLISAEDHRSSLHHGIDQIGMLRAICVRIFRKEVQGASTIEQQFVRVVTGSYSRTIKRKLIEQMLATLLVKKRSKNNIARAYLAIAYYGYKYRGVDGVFELIGPDIELASEEKIISVIARLKYPEPSNSNEIWKQKVNRRINYIKKRYKAVNKSRQKVDCKFKL